MKKTLKENRVMCVCRKCNKPYSYDKLKGYAFGDKCRECSKKRGDKNG
jgi:Zn finger protein HypA/HybF involved in hydrogenase expression